MITLLPNHRSIFEVIPFKIYRNFESTFFIKVATDQTTETLSKTLLFTDQYQCATFKIHAKETTLQQGVNRVVVVYDGIYKRKNQCHHAQITLNAQTQPLFINCKPTQIPPSVEPIINPIHIIKENRTSFYFNEILTNIQQGYSSSVGNVLSKIALYNCPNNITLQGNTYTNGTFIPIQNLNLLKFEAENTDEKKEYQLEYSVEDNMNLESTKSTIHIQTNKKINGGIITPLHIEKPLNQDVDFSYYMLDFKNAYQPISTEKLKAVKFLSGVNNLYLGASLYTGEYIDISNFYLLAFRAYDTENTTILNIEGVADNGEETPMSTLTIAYKDSSTNTIPVKWLPIKTTIMQGSIAEYFADIQYTSASGQHLQAGQILFNSNDVFNLQIEVFEDEVLYNEGTIYVKVTANAIAVGTTQYTANILGGDLKITLRIM